MASLTNYEVRTRKSKMVTPEVGREAPVILQNHSNAWPHRQSLHCAHCKGELLHGSSPRVKSSYKRNLELRGSTLKFIKWKFISKC